MYGKQKSNNPAKDFDINDIDDLLNSTLKDVDEDLDMNDPELLVSWNTKKQDFMYSSGHRNNCKRFHPLLLQLNQRRSKN